MDHATTLAKHSTGAAEPRLSPLEAFVAWVANLIRTITGMKRRKTFPPNWKDHWQGLRQLEWCWDQMLAACAREVLSGGHLDHDIGFDLIMEVPDSYGRPCPSTPEEMNRRFILQARMKLDPDKYILRHIRRIAKREGVRLDSDMGTDPLRHATKTSRATSPGYAGGGKAPAHLASTSRFATGGGGMRVLHAHDGGGLAFSARAPPIPTAYSPLPQRAARLRTQPHARRLASATPPGDDPSNLTHESPL